MSRGSPSENLLGFDYGTRRIGIAVGNTLTGTARGLTTVRSDPQPDWQSLKALFDEWQPHACVIGLPLNMDGTEQPLTRATRRFAEQLHERYERPVHTMDERLSSVAAREALKSQRAAGRRRRVRAGEKDSEAARIILEDWLGLQT